MARRPAMFHSSSTEALTNNKLKVENRQLTVDEHSTDSSSDPNLPDKISTSSLEFLAKLSDAEPTHGLLVPSKKRTNSNFAYTMILRGHTYHVCYRRQTPRGERVYWRCQLRGQCKARLITDLDGKIVQFTNPVHSHPSSARLNTQQQRCIQALLTTVEENIDFLQNGQQPDSNLIGPPAPSMATSSSPCDEFLPPLSASSSTRQQIFESPNTSSSSADLLDAPRKQSRKRSVKTTKSQQTGEIDLDEVLRQIPQLQQTLKMASYYNDEKDADENEEEDEDENNNENDGSQNEVKPKLERDETVYEDTDSSSVASPDHLSDSQRRYLIDSLTQSGWTSCTLNGSNRESIQKSFVFSDFNEAFGFMNRVAMKAETLHRHPKWTNIYNKLDVQLPANPQQQALSIADLHLAKFVDEIYHH